jgi:hypothetical protein
VELSTLSRVGKEANDVVWPPSVNASRILPSTITMDSPAARTPKNTLLPNNPFFTMDLSLDSGKQRPIRSLVKLYLTALEAAYLPVQRYYISR